MLLSACRFSVFQRMFTVCQSPLFSYLPVYFSHCHIPSLPQVSQSLMQISANDIRKTALLFNADVNEFFIQNITVTGMLVSGPMGAQLSGAAQCAHAENKVSCILFCSNASVFQLSLLFHCLHPSHAKSGDVKAQN